MISVREARAILRPDDSEWRNRFICIEGKMKAALPFLTVKTLNA